MVVRDFSLPCSSGASNALVNPYDAEATSACTSTDADDDTGGWLALHKRRHQRAFTPYLAAAAAAAAARPPTPNNPLSRAQAEILHMALEFEAENSDKNSVTVSTAPSTTAGASVANAASVAGVAGVAGGVGPSTAAPGERLPKASFLGRCSKVLSRKRSFWKKKEEN